MAALTGHLVVDLSRVLAGPFCGQLLADMGANVIKIESPEGDENRKWPPLTSSGESSNYASVNRGKRSLTLNLKAPGAAEVLRGLAAKADVLLHSFLPDTAARLGIDYEELRAINPRLVFCTISGYGAQGPLRNKPGYDLMVQAFSGVMSTTGFEGGPPIRTGVSFIDMSTGLSAYAAIMTALVARNSTGKGTWVRASLLETGVAILGYHAVSWLQGSIMPRREGSGVWHLVPYQAFRCLDGHLLAGATNDSAWQRFAMRSINRNSPAMSVSAPMRAAPATVATSSRCWRRDSRRIRSHGGRRVSKRRRPRRPAADGGPGTDAPTGPGERHGPDRTRRRRFGGAAARNAVQVGGRRRHRLPLTARPRCKHRRRSTQRTLDIRITISVRFVPKERFERSRQFRCTGSEPGQLYANQPPSIAMGLPVISRAPSLQRNIAKAPTSPGTTKRCDGWRCAR